MNRLRYLFGIGGIGIMAPFNLFFTVVEVYNRLINNIYTYKIINTHYSAFISIKYIYRAVTYYLLIYLIHGV